MRVKTCIISSAVAFMLGAFLLWSVSERVYTRRIDKLSNEVSRGQAINRELQDRNRELAESNTRATESIGILERRLAESESGAGKIAGSLGSVAAGLGESGNDLQGIIDGLGSIKTLVQSLP